MFRAYTPSTDGQVHYREAGTPEGPPLVLFHQSPCSSQMYERLISLLPQEYRIIAPDTPGFGGTDPLDDGPSIEGFAEVLGDALAGIDARPWHVFGHHTGSVVAMAIVQAGALPVRSLTLSGPPYFNDELRELLTSLYRSSADAPSMTEHLQDSWARIQETASDVPGDLLLRDFAQGLLVQDLPGVYRSAMSFDPLAALAHATMPTMILAGGRDPISSGFPVIREAVPHARYVELPEGGIQMCELQAPEIADNLRTFLAEVEAG